MEGRGAAPGWHAWPAWPAAGCVRPLGVLGGPLDVVPADPLPRPPRNMFTATKSRLDTNWDLLHAYFGELRLKDWKPLNGTTAFFQSEEIMSDPWCM